MANNSKTDAYIMVHKAARDKPVARREFVPFARLLATEADWQRIQEYAAIPSLCDSAQQSRPPKQ